MAQISQAKDELIKRMIDSPSAKDTRLLAEAINSLVNAQYSEQNIIYMKYQHQQQVKQDKEVK